MFSGLITHQGKVKGLKAGVLEVQVPRFQAKRGDSVAINGVCLTVIGTGKRLTFELSKETLQKTTLKKLAAGAPVNVEAAIKAKDALGGHIVQGHVDGTGTVAEIKSDKTVWFKAPPEILKYAVVKGSITVDGVSLTIAAIKGNRFSVALIPYTLAHTTLRNLSVGASVNLEADILAKYALKHKKKI